MKNYKKTLISLLLLLPFLTFAHNLGIDKITKKIHKETAVNPNALVQIRNQYGDLNISTWNENKVVIDVVISVEGRNQARMEEKLRSIDVDFTLSNERVSAITQIDDYWGFSWFKKYNINFRIDYTVKMPATNQVDLSNDYGAIALNYLEGKAEINCDYGKIIIGELKADNNKLNFDYTSNSSIEYIKSGKINADYSSFEVENAGTIELIADYTASQFENIENLNYRNDYGKLQIGKAKKVIGRGDYLTFRMDEITAALELNNEYGSIRVGHVAPTTREIDIQTDYTGIQLGIDRNWAFQFMIEMQYGSLRYDLDLDFKKQIIDNTEKYYEGYHLSPNENQRLVIHSEYGSIKLNSSL